MHKHVTSKEFWLVRAIWQNQLSLETGITPNPAIPHAESQEVMRKDMHCITAYIINKIHETT